MLLPRFHTQYFGDNTIPNLTQLREVDWKKLRKFVQGSLPTESKVVFVIVSVQQVLHDDLGLFPSFNLPT